MALKRKTIRRRASITSLIDVIFLLLLFFMLASTFSKFSDVEVSVAQSTRGVSSDSAQSVGLLIEPRHLTVDDQPVSDDEVQTFLSTLSRDRPLTVTIRATDDCNTQRLVDIFNRLGRIDGVNLVVVDPR